MNSFSTKKIYLSLLFFSIFSSTVFAVQNIGVANMDYIFRSFYKTKLEDSRIKKQTEIFRQYLISMNDQKIKINEEFVNLRDSAQNIAYSDAERENYRIAAQNKYRQLQAKDEEIKKYNDEKKKQLVAEYEKIRKNLLLEVVKVAKAKAKRENLSILLDNSGLTSNSIPAVIYYEKSIDITDAVIKELNLGMSDKK